MSLVERALKKLQESRSPGSSPPVMRDRQSTNDETAAQALNEEWQGAERLDESIANVAPWPRPRVINIDRNALRAMELLPPANVERQIASQYQHIKRTLIASAFGKNGAVPHGHLIMMASAVPGEGKTFTSLNLALSMALEKDIEVLLVDADVAKPHLSGIFGLSEERGLMDLLSDSKLHAESLIFPTNVANLSLLPAGHQIETATELLASARMEQVVRELTGTRRRIVLFDSPPLLLSTESRALVPHVGQVVLVVRAEVTPQKAVFDAIDALGEGRPVGLILNQTEALPSSGYYGYGTYGGPNTTSESPS